VNLDWTGVMISPFDNDLADERRWIYVDLIVFGSHQLDVFVFDLEKKICCCVCISGDQIGDL
jgi:hypothetical protein